MVGYQGHLPGDVDGRSVFQEENHGPPNSTKDPDFEATLRIIRQANADEVVDRTRIKVHTAWCDTRPDLAKYHNPWKSGILGYTGHLPLWVKDKQSFEVRKELGKTNYVPRFDRFNTIVQPR